MVVISALSTYLAYYFNIIFHVDLTLLSIAIVFPLVFAIRGSFRRREKALNHLSKFRSALQTVHYFVVSNPELTEQSKEEMADILVEISEETLGHLAKKTKNTTQLDEIIERYRDL